jgi:hypothetical protein
LSFSLKEALVRLTIIHDIQGNIASVAASPPDSPVAYLEMKPGQRMTEVEAPELTLDQGIEYIRKRMTHLMETHRVAIESTEGRLIKKPGVAAEKPSA